MDVDQQPTEKHAHKGVLARPHGQRGRSVCVCMIVTLDHDRCGIGPDGGESTAARLKRRAGRPLQLATASTVLVIY